MIPLHQPEVIEIIKRSLFEDIRTGDISSLSSVPEEVTGKMKLLVKEDGIIAGIDIAKMVMREVDPSVTMKIMMKDGDLIKKGDVVFELEGAARSMLTAERTILNFMQRMSGIATSTRNYCNALQGSKTQILDTRKTTPNLRVIEKYAVTVGGGVNHRFGLYDMIMLKDNHIDFAGSIEKAIDQAVNYIKENKLEVKIEVETRTIDDVKQILAHGGVDRIMLDNFSPTLIKEAITLINGKIETEISGGITLQNIHDYANLGADFISIGALTHHVKSLDLSLKFIAN